MRKLDFTNDKYFDCDGKSWEVTESLSFIRYRELEKISLEFGYSANFEDIFNQLKKGVELYNKHDYFSMSITLFKILEGVGNIGVKDNAALRICALFINEKGEDPTSFSEAMMKAKIDAWGKELAVDPFFYLAASLVPGWLPAYEMHIRNGSKEVQKEESPKQ